jgi:methylmalonyl-CoA mutase N-terminal domain/subunit
MKIDESIQQMQVQKLKELRANRDNQLVQELLKELATAAAGTENLMPIVIRCVEAYATLGEIADELRHVFGEYKG